MPSFFRDAFVAHCKGAIEKARLLSPMKHMGLQGQLREVLMADMLRPMLAPDFKLGTGKLVTHDGEESPQIDVIVYAPSILPPFLYDNSTGFFPVESCLYTVEVKSRLTAATLKEAIKNARGVRALKTLNAIHYAPDWTGKTLLDRKEMGLVRSVNALFSFGSDLSASPEAELARYRKYDTHADTAPAIQVFCIVGRGYWYSAEGGGWKYQASTVEIDEVMEFLAGTTNTIPMIYAMRGRPQFGKYISNEIQHISV